MPPRQSSSVWEIIKFTLVTLAVVVPIRAYVAQPFIVSGASMAPTFAGGEYLIIDELSYQLRPPRRGEVVIFRYPRDPAKFFIKRVIGLPGETVSLDSDGVKIIGIDGRQEILIEPYAKVFSAPIQSWSLKTGEYFMLGDNRPASLDSRSWGVVSKKLIIGRAFLRLWPPERIDFQPGDASNQTTT